MYPMNHANEQTVLADVAVVAAAFAEVYAFVVFAGSLPSILIQIAAHPYLVSLRLVQNLPSSVVLQ
jgi:hypothetical protein